MTRLSHVSGSLNCGLLFGLLSGCLLAGCEGGPNGVFTTLKPATATDQPFLAEPEDEKDEELSHEELEVKYRQQYQTHRDPEALRWLLCHCVRQGMTVSEVGEVLGQDGQREFDDRRLKVGNPTVHANDKAYRWGPDSNGRTTYFLFRDNRLLNFDPEEFAANTE